VNHPGPLSDRARSARTAALADRYALALVAIEAALIALHTGLGQHAFFNLDREYNLGSWFSSLQLFALSGACVAAFHRDSRAVAGRWLWWILAVGCCYLSLDETMAIHEGVREDSLQGLAASSLLRRLPPWQIVFAPALAIAALTFSSIFASRFAGRPACWVPAAIGLGLWGTAFAFDGTARALFTPAGLQEVEVALEEFMEMAGATLILLAVCRYVSSVEPCRIGISVPAWKRRLAWSVPVTVVLLVPVGAIVTVNAHERVSAPSTAGRDPLPADSSAWAGHLFGPALEDGRRAPRRRPVAARRGLHAPDALALLDARIRNPPPQICRRPPDRGLHLP
jgi:hypothetical protein